MYFFETKFMATMNAEELIYTQACASVDYMNRNNQEHQVMLPEFQTFDTLREHKVVCTLLNVLNLISSSVIILITGVPFSTKLIVPCFNSPAA